jgi:ubiquinone/menaquinone biosynthesis C-methylase UbiE
MTERNKDKPDMKYQVMDICNMTFPDNYFDLAIDKSTMDALLCGDNASLNVAKMTNEV